MPYGPAAQNSPTSDMPEKEADPISTPASTNERSRSNERNWFQRVAAFMPETRRLLFWLAVTGGLTMGMRAANHILSAPKGDSYADVAPASGHSSSSGPGVAVWWAPTAPLDQSSNPAPAPVQRKAPVASSGNVGRSIIPVEQGAGFLGGKLTLNSPIRSGATNTREAYAILGLSRSSSPSISGGINGNTGAASAFGEKEGSGPSLHFSLAGNLNRVPVDNLSTSGTGANLVAVPEPSAAAMLIAGLGSLLMVRRRQSAA